MIKTMAMKHGGIGAEVTAEDVVAAYYEHRRLIRGSDPVSAYRIVCTELVEMLAGKTWSPISDDTATLKRFRHFCYALREAHYGDQKSGDSPETPERVWEKRQCRVCKGAGVIQTSRERERTCHVCEGTGFKDVPKAREGEG